MLKRKHSWRRVVLVNQGACTTRRCGCKSRKREQSCGAECECQRCTNVTGSPQQQDVAEEEGEEEEEKDDYRLYNIILPIAIPVFASYQRLTITY